MNSLSPLGWFLILFLVVIFIGINVSLFTAQKKKNEPDSWVARMQKAGDTMRNPFQKEDEKMDHLAQKISGLKLEQKKDIYDGDKNE